MFDIGGYIVKPGDKITIMSSGRSDNVQNRLWREIESSFQIVNRWSFSFSYSIIELITVKIYSKSWRKYGDLFWRTSY